MRVRLLTCLFLFVACGGCKQSAPPPSIAVDLGSQQVRFRVPEGWMHVDHGREQRFEVYMGHISLTDLGPATPAGFAETIGIAQELFEENQWEDARTLLVASNPRRFFTSEARWMSVQDDWKSLTRIRRVEAADVEGAIEGDVVWEVLGAFHDLLVQVSALPQPDLDSLADTALPELGHDSLRDVASRRAMAVSGRPALRVDTWDRLSHLGRRSHLFVLSEGRLLCLRMEFGQTEILAPAFESLSSSLRIDPAHGEAGT